MAPLKNEPHIATLLDVPKNAQAGITTYTNGGESDPTHMSYSEFQTLVQQKAGLLQLHKYNIPGKIILLHFQSHLENITWFWASILVGCIPAISSPRNEDCRKQNSHFKRLDFLLHSPIVLTTRNLASSDFAQNKVLRVITVEDIENLKSSAPGLQTPTDSLVYVSSSKSTNELFNKTNFLGHSPETIAVIMLTSRNTGLSKAICLTHTQIFASLKGMVYSMPLPPGSTLLNWTALGHTSSLIEIHLFAMFTGLGQVHVPTVNVETEPLLFLRLFSKHNVSRTFAPSSFLYKLQYILDTASPEEIRGVDLGGLLYIGSDGEANNVENCVRISDILKILGAKSQMGNMLN